MFAHSRKNLHTHTHTYTYTHTHTHTHTHAHSLFLCIFVSLACARVCFPFLSLLLDPTPPPSPLFTSLSIRSTRLTHIKYTLTERTTGKLRALSAIYHPLLLLRASATQPSICQWCCCRYPSPPHAQPCNSHSFNLSPPDNLSILFPSADDFFLLRVSTTRWF